MTESAAITVEYIRGELAQIAEFTEDYDHEYAHRDEDALRDKVLHAIADGAPDPAELAAEVLRSGEIVFIRWYT